MVKGIRDGAGGGGGFIMMESIHYEVADGAARSARSGAQLCAAMDGERKLIGMGIEQPCACSATQQRETVDKSES